MRPPGGEANQPTAAGQFVTAPDKRNGFQPYVGKSATEYPIGTPGEPRQPAYTIERKKKPADGETIFTLASFSSHSLLSNFPSLTLSGQSPSLALCSATASASPLKWSTSSARWNEGAAAAAAAAAEAKSTGESAGACFGRRECIRPGRGVPQRGQTGGSSTTAAAAGAAGAAAQHQPLLLQARASSPAQDWRGADGLCASPADQIAPFCVTALCRPKGGEEGADGDASPAAATIPASSHEDGDSRREPTDDVPTTSRAPWRRDRNAEERQPADGIPEWSWHACRSRRLLDLSVPGPRTGRARRRFLLPGSERDDLRARLP